MLHLSQTNTEWQIVKSVGLGDDDDGDDDGDNDDEKVRLSMKDLIRVAVVQQILL